MLQGHFSQHWTDKDGNPTGGCSCGLGFSISWQNGPIGIEGREPNGAFVETVLNACLGRLEFYEQSRFSCEYNRDAIKHIQLALSRLNDRTADRIGRGVEGKHEE